MAGVPVFSATPTPFPRQVKPAILGLEKRGRLTEKKLNGGEVIQALKNYGMEIGGFEPICVYLPKP
jgi:hypothetical protein